MVRISNFLYRPYTLEEGTHIAMFSILTLEQTKHIRTVNPVSIRHPMAKSLFDASVYLKDLLKTAEMDESHEA